MQDAILESIHVSTLNEIGCYWLNLLVNFCCRTKITSSIERKLWLKTKLAWPIERDLLNKKNISMLFKWSHTKNRQQIDNVNDHSIEYHIETLHTINIHWWISIDHFHVIFQSVCLCDH